MKKIRISILYVTIVLAFYSCSGLEITIPDSPIEVAVPIIDSRISMLKVSEFLDKGNASLRFNPDGKATAYYSGEVIKQDANAIFPAYPGNVPFQIADTNAVVGLPLNNSYKIKNAIFKDTKIKFGFNHPTNQAIKIVIQINEVSKNGSIFKKEIDIPASPSGTATFITEDFSLDDWSLQSNNNSLTFKYTATLADGQKIKLNTAAMLFDFLKFKYIDGYLGFHEFGLDGSVIDISLFDRWISGGFKFEDPKISIQVENGFGLPVKSKINNLELETLEGNKLSLESQFITDGINFAYPSFNELGQSKFTSFYFDKNNSNIEDLFTEKIVNIKYDIDALVNSAKDTSARGYITENSFFVINVDVEVPLEGSVDSFNVADTFDVDIPVPSEVTKAEIKIETLNDFPTDVIINGLLIDANNNVIGKLFENPIKLKAAPLGSDNKTSAPTKDVTIEIYDGNKLAILAKTKRIRIQGQLTTTGSNVQKPLWIFKDYGIGLKVGAIFDYQR